MEVTSTWYLVLGALLFTVGAVGLLVRRNPRAHHHEIGVRKERRPMRTDFDGDARGPNRIKTRGLLRVVQRHARTARAKELRRGEPAAAPAGYHDMLPCHVEMHRTHLSFNVVRLKSAKTIDRIRNRVMTFGSSHPMSSKW